MDLQFFQLCRSVCFEQMQSNIQLARGKTMRGQLLFFFVAGYIYEGIWPVVCQSQIAWEKRALPNK